MGINLYQITRATVRTISTLLKAADREKVPIIIRRTKVRAAWAREI